MSIEREIMNLGELLNKYSFRLVNVSISIVIAVVCYFFNVGTIDTLVITLIVFLSGLSLEILHSHKRTTSTDSEILTKLGDVERFYPFLENYFMTVRHEDLHKRLLAIYSEVAKLIKSKQEDADKNGHTQSALFGKYFNVVLENCCNKLSLINNKEYCVFEDNVRVFWREEIMGTLWRDLWTTNISDFAGSFGRMDDEDLIQAQKKAIDKGASITRVFIYDPYGKEDVERLKLLMKKQLGVKIKVRAIEKQKFFKAAGHRIDLIGSPDVMILDNVAIYITITEGNAVKSAKLLGQKEKIAAAIQLRKIIGKDGVSYKVTYNNIDSVIKRGIQRQN